MSKSSLAIEGGTPVRKRPMPTRNLFRREELRAVKQVFRQGARTGVEFGYNGQAEKQYEAAFAEFMGGGYADGVNSGTNAVFCALGALQLDPFSEVILPPITDPGGAMPVIFNSCIPVFADADPRSYNTSVGEIEKVLTDRTRAIVVAHIAGEPVDMDPIMELAKRKNLFVIEDCAQAHGALYKNRLVGTIGHIAAFSTMSGKHHATGGQGGVVYTRDEELSWKGRRFADRGKPFNLESSGNVVAGLNCNLNDLSAAIGSVQIPKLPDAIRRRRRVGETVRQGLAADGAVRVGWQVPETQGVYWFLRIFVALDKLRVGKEQFCKAVEAEGVPVNPSYRHIPAEAPWHRGRVGLGNSGFPWSAVDYKGVGTDVCDLVGAIAATDSHFNIHFHERYGDREAQDIVSALLKVANAYRRV
jgi:perosamine synthetase